MKKMKKHGISGIAALALLVPFCWASAQQDWETEMAAAGAAQIAAVRAFGQRAHVPPAIPLEAPRGRPTHQPAALRSLLDRVGQTAASGKAPVILFDLDDTLIDTAYRHMTIIKEFAGQADVQGRFPDAARKMGALGYGGVRYQLVDTLNAVGVAEAEKILPELTTFWSARFFDNAYLLLDQANAGAVDYVRETIARGGTVVYLTGRWEQMRLGTEQSMKGMGFPLANGRNVFLMMKPDRQQSDIDFKKAAFDEIARLGEVVGGCENEPANVNAYQQRFPEGIYIFLDTRHSTTAAVPLPSIFWVGDFRY